MPVQVTVNGNAAESTDSAHAERNIFNNFGYQIDGTDTLEIIMDAWPCTSGPGDRTTFVDCHTFLKRASKNRTIIVQCIGDHGGYASGHGSATTGIIKYVKGVVSGSKADQYAKEAAERTKSAEASAANRPKGKGPVRKRQR